MPEKRNAGHDAPCQQTSTPLLAEIGRRGGYLLDVEQDKGWVLWCDDAAAVGKVKRDCMPWVLANHAALVAEVRACSPAMRGWHIPAQAEVRVWDWGETH